MHVCSTPLPKVQNINTITCGTSLITTICCGFDKENEMPKKSKKERVWNKAKEIRGKDSKLYRQDSYGNTMYYPSYGKKSPMGWEMDHITPKSKEGSNAVINLQAMNRSVNRQKSNDKRKKSRHSKTNK